MEIVWIIYLAAVVLAIAGMWKTFDKAGKPGWAAIVPIYNAIVLLEVAGKPGWWIILFFVPIVNLVITVIMFVGIADQFGKGAGFAVGLWLLPFIFFPILGFGSAQYGGRAAAPPAPAAPQASSPPPPAPRS